VCYRICAALGMLLLLAPSKTMATGNDDLPLLYGIEINGEQAMVQVVSNGCTEPSDFVLELRGTGEEAELTVKRLREDHCRMAPHIVELSLDLPDDDEGRQGLRFSLVNRLSSPGSLRRRSL
jgi:hypothetical protein